MSDSYDNLEERWRYIYLHWVHKKSKRPNYPEEKKNVGEKVWFPYFDCQLHELPFLIGGKTNETLG